MYAALHELEYKKGIGKPKEYIIAQEQHEVGEDLCAHWTNDMWDQLFNDFKNTLQ